MFSFSLHFNSYRSGTEKGRNSITKRIGLFGLFIGLVVSFITLASSSVSASPPMDQTVASCTSVLACNVATGGMYITTARNSCTAGLPVRTAQGVWYILTAGHCVYGGLNLAWQHNHRVLGSGTHWEYGSSGTTRVLNGDYGLIKITPGRGWAPRSRVLVVTTQPRIQSITATRSPRKGETVCTTGGATHNTRCGRVTDINISTQYASPGLSSRTIGNLMIISGVCARPGDSGSPVFAGHAFIGILVMATSSPPCYSWATQAEPVLSMYRLGITPE